MNSDPQSILAFLSAHLFERTIRLNNRPVSRDGEFILYWMHHAVRDHENPALDTAVTVGNRLGLPVLVYQGLGGRHPYNSDRHHTFIMEGARDVHASLAHRGIAHCFFLPVDPADPSPLKKLITRAALCLTEAFPVPPFKAWIGRMAKISPVAFWAVDTACILPMPLLNKSFSRAYQFRKATWHAYEHRIACPYKDAVANVDPFCGRLGFEPVDLLSADIGDLCAKCRIDHAIWPVAHTPGGTTAGYRRWEQYKQHGLHRYARTRNDAAIGFPEGVSRMSPYLHHGHVSPFRIARQAAAAGAEKFLDELLIWRELAHHFCFLRDDPGTLDALPQWAVKTLVAHRQDPRRFVFSWETLARAKTGDPLWDAAQTSLRIHGELHNNVRMTWGKAILQWTPSPEIALQMMIDLNHRFALDGSDPNSYGGILWCLGLFDRPFEPEKPIIGTLRPRSTRSHAARLDMDRYVAKVSLPAVPARRRVAVIGAGLSGLVAARTLADSGHRLRVFEKARGPGGRMSTRRTEVHAFDHGAQYFTLRDERFRLWVNSWMDAGIIRRWEGRIRVFRGGQIQREHRRHQRFVGVPGMSAVARHLSADLDVCFRTRVANIQRAGRGFVLTDEHGDELDSCDVLIVSAPSPQSAQLLANQTDLAARIRSVEMNPCWTVLMAFDTPLALAFDGAFIHDADIVWAARNSDKPGRGAGECWVLHAAADWSSAHLEMGEKDVIRQLTASFFTAAGRSPVTPVFAAAHRWRYAQARKPLEDGSLWDRRAMIGVCGDWCCGSRIEGAFLSGAAMAGRILADLSG